MHYAFCQAISACTDGKKGVEVLALDELRMLREWIIHGKGIQKCTSLLWNHTLAAETLAVCIYVDPVQRPLIYDEASPSRIIAFSSALESFISPTFPKSMGLPIESTSIWGSPHFNLHGTIFTYLYISDIKRRTTILNPARCGGVEALIAAPVWSFAAAWWTTQRHIATSTTNVAK